MATPGADRGKVEKFSVYLTFDLIAFIWSLKLDIVLLVLIYIKSGRNLTGAEYNFSKN